MTDRRHDPDDPPLSDEERAALDQWTAAVPPPDLAAKVLERLAEDEAPAIEPRGVVSRPSARRRGAGPWLLAAGVLLAVGAATCGAAAAAARTSSRAGGSWWKILARRTPSVLQPASGRSSGMSSRRVFMTITLRHAWPAARS